MFLSRLKMPLGDPAAQRLLADPYELHRALMAAFPPKAGRVLFRVEPLGRTETQACVLVQSTTQPHWGPERLPPSMVSDVKPYHPVLTVGQRLRFRLRANPTVRRKFTDRAEGLRVGVVGEERQRAWLEAKGKAAGFQPEGVVVIDEGQMTGRKPTGDHRLIFQSVRYEGALSVTDAELLLAAVARGIGSGKAFGFGLLSVARASP